MVKTARNPTGETAAQAKKSRTMTSRRSAVEALARDPVAHGRSRLGRRPGTLTDKDMEAQGFRMRNSTWRKFWQNLEIAHDSANFSTLIVETFQGRFI